ncbi:S8 family serine peptidase [Winogradskyella forsetii]|uniref:S8 family serine peptidase n=1 Tax=Winogradskyella forsetii TaxID=2686077 RepID=UPI0015B978DF|nr:S8 family serine peptidase [Winogradskyella forsetii]
MKNYLFTMTLLIMINHCFAQNSNSNKLSSGNYELLKDLEKQENERLSRIEDYLQLNPHTKVTLKDNFSLTHIYDIVDGVVLYKSTDNLNAGRATKTNHLQVGGSLNLNLDGTGMTIGVWDGGPADNTHPEFSNSTNSGSRVTIIDNSVVDGDTGFSSHGTHVTGTISAKGINSSALGMAPNVNVKSYNWSNDESEMVSAANNASSPILISNHSYGVPIVPNDGDPLPAWFMGAYTQDAADVDNISKNNPKYLIVASAGNAGSTAYSGGLYAGYDKLTTDKNAKNNLVIANANPAIAEQPLFSGNYSITNLVINSGSSQGPTDDFRIKPDIAADGTAVLSPVPGNGYASFNGTSMSSPNTAGTLILLQQYYQQLHGVYMNSSTLKGLVCHTSVDASAIGPDPIFGWGFLDAKASAETILDGMNGEAIVDELNLAQDEIYSTTFSAQAGDKLIASISWTDMPGNVVANGSLNDSQPRLVNDLDLRLAKDGVEFFPWKLDYSAASGFSNSRGDNIVDNIERVEIDAPSTGVYTLTVTHKGLLKGNVGGPFDPQTQDFALIVTGNNVTLGVDNNLLTNNLVVFPNPNKGEFTISFDSNLSNNEDVKVEIHDISGRIVYNKNFVNNTVQFNKTINLGGVASGVYIANISKGSHITSHKIIIE